MKNEDFKSQNPCAELNLPIDYADIRGGGNLIYGAGGDLSAKLPENIQQQVDKYQKIIDRVDDLLAAGKLDEHPNREELLEKLGTIALNCAVKIKKLEQMAVDSLFKEPNASDFTP